MGTVLGVTTPIYLLIAAGYAAVRLGWMAQTDIRALGRFVAQFCIPALLFKALSRLSLAEVLHVDYLTVFAAGSLLSLTTVTLIARLVRGRPLAMAAMQGMGASSSNSAFVGYPIVQMLIGPTAGVALALNTLVENLLVMPLALALADSESGGRRPLQALRNTLLGLARNPMILAILAGLTVSALGLKMPAVVERTVSLAAAAAPPTALFAIGGTLVGLKLSGIRGDLALVAGAKLVLHPLCVLACVWLLPPADPALRAAAVLFAAMPMLSIYPVLAQRYGHGGFCAAALLAATVASFFSISLLIALLPAGWVGAG